MQRVGKLTSRLLMVFSVVLAIFIGVAVPTFASYDIPLPVNNNAPSAAQDYINAESACAASGVPNLGCTTAGLGPLVDGKKQPAGIFGNLLSAMVVGVVGGTSPGGTTVGSTGFYYPGAIASTFHMTSLALTNPPASSREYIADLMQNMGHPFVQSAYAQGIGFSSLSPVLGLWKVFRNVAYFFFVIIFVFVGFLIMIRSKIGSQAAVTVQQALPKIVISLILVTFSYAIAGLMIDAMYLVIYLLIGIFSTAGSSDLSFAKLTTIAFQNNFFTNGADMLVNVSGSLGGSIGNIVNALTTNVFGGTDVAKAVGTLSGGLTSVVATLVIGVAILVAMFRVFFALIQAYVGVFFSVILGPIQLLLGALPGQNTFGAWLKGLVENLLVFPTLILLIFITYYFIKSPTVSFSSNNTGFSPPQLGSNQGSAGFSAFQGIIALGAVMAMPEVMKVTKGLMKGQLGISGAELGKNLSAGVPLGSRIALAPTAGGLAGGLQFGAEVFKNRGKLGSDARAVFSNAYNTSFASKEGGFRKGMSAGITGANFITRATNAKNPDILEPPTNLIDKTFNPKVAEREKRLQELEDLAERLNLTNKHP